MEGVKLKFDRLAYQRQKRRETDNLYTKRYERQNPKGFLMRVYRNMLSRVTGVQKREEQYYKGLYILPREEFYAWTLANTNFWVLWHDWQRTGRMRGYAPSIHRLDSAHGYTVENMDWITQSENSALLRADRRYRPSKRSTEYAGC